MVRQSATLIELVRGLCEALLADERLAPIHDALSPRLAELSDPLRIAVSGHVSAGKSTMVNALIGRRLAQTGRGETTMVNAWFVRGRPERTVYLIHGGRRIEAPLPTDGKGGPVPENLDCDALQAVTYVLDEPLLDEMTLIDTPGLFSPNAEHSERAEALVSRTREAANTANALIYVTQEIPGSAVDDRQLLAFQSLFGGLSGKMPINAVLVLSKIDEKWDVAGEDPRTPFEIARQLTAAHGQELWKRVWTTTPLIGRLAELGRTELSLSEQEMQDLRALATFVPRRRLLESQSAYTRAGVTVGRGAALRARLGSYGLWRALHLIDTGCDSGELLEGLCAESGLGDLVGIITEVFRSRVDVLRAESVLSAVMHEVLTAPGLDASACSYVAQRIEQVLLSDGARGLRRVHALRLVCDEDGRELRLSERRRLELRHLFGQGVAAQRLGIPADTPPIEMARHARQSGRRWRALENSFPVLPTLRSVAELASESYGELAAQIERQVAVARN